MQCTEQIEYKRLLKLKADGLNTKQPVVLDLMVMSRMNKNEELKTKFVHGLIVHKT